MQDNMPGAMEIMKIYKPYIKYINLNIKESKIYW